MTLRTAGRVVGGLLLAAFFLYFGGSSLIVSAAGTSTPVPENATSVGLLSLGAVLVLLNSAAVVTIGVLAFRVLHRGHRRTARVYLATRTAEAVLLALAPLGMLTLAVLAPGAAETSGAVDSGLPSLARSLVENGESQYSLAMATLGVGSIFFCRALLRSGLLPRFLATWGIVGYAIFALGSVLDLAGYAVGIAAAVPGGLFEVAAGSYLLVKGFREAMPDAPATPSPALPVGAVRGGTSDTR